MRRNQLLVGIQDRSGVHVLDQELLGSEYRIKNLEPEVLIDCVKNRVYLERDESSPRLIKPFVTVDNSWRWKCNIIHNPPCGTSTHLLIYNTITEKWELWTDNNGVYKVVVGRENLR